MKNYTLEVCVDSVESALAAARAGATRLELCQNLVIGGTTPSLELFRQIRSQTDIRIHVLIRPRFGDFLYTDNEYEIMKREIKAFAEAGAEGIVIGSLNADGSLNEEQMKGMIESAKGCWITLHRAFDVCADPFTALETAQRLGINCILTSGQEADCLQGQELIRRLVEKSRENGIQIMAGAGVNRAVINEMLKKPGLTAFHMSGKRVLPSGMSYRNPRVHMGLPGISEFEIWQTSEEAVAQAVQVLEAVAQRSPAV